MSKTILITGAGRGIGRATAIEIAKYNKKQNIDLNLVICSRTTSELETTASLAAVYGAKILSIACDISSCEDRARMLDMIKSSVGAVDVLINNAGISHIGLLQDMTTLELSHLMNTNLEAAIALSAAIIPDLLSSEHSPRIINISSVWGNVGASCEVAYSAAKGGLNAFTKALAKELAPSHIPVNAIACGYIDTEMNSHLSEEDKQTLFDEIPAGRPGTTEEIAQIVYMLLETTDYLTGQIITVDGGWT